MADLKRGDNLNPGADPETGTFVGGTIEEQQETISELSAEARRLAQEKYDEILNLTKDFFTAVRKEVQYLRDKVPPKKYNSDDTVPVSEIDLPDNGGSNKYPLQETFGGSSSSTNTIYVVKPYRDGAVAEGGVVNFACLQDYVLETILQYCEIEDDLSDLFVKLIYVFQLFFPAPNIATDSTGGIDTGGFHTALVKYLTYCKKFDMQTGTTGFKINRFLGYKFAAPAKHVLRHMSRTQHVVENLCQYYMYELFVAFEQDQEFLSSKYDTVSTQYGRNFERYRSDLQQEDYDSFRSYIVPTRPEPDSGDYSRFIDATRLRYTRAKRISETDQSGKTVGDYFYGVIGIQRGDVSDFAGLDLSDLLTSLQTRYLQSLQNE